MEVPKWNSKIVQTPYLLVLDHLTGKERISTCCTFPTSVWQSLLCTISKETTRVRSETWFTYAFGFKYCVVVVVMAVVCSSRRQHEMHLQQRRDVAPSHRCGSATQPIKTSLSQLHLFSALYGVYLFRIQGGGGGT